MSTTAERAIAATLDWLGEQDAPESAIAAQEAGGADSGEESARWVEGIISGERGGAWDDDLLATAHALLTIQELQRAAELVERDPAIGRALDWMAGRRSQPGAWTDGCTPDRHQRGYCHHFAGGFYSPAPPDHVLDGIELPSGASVASDTEARFVISATSLRCWVLWRGVGTDARLHLEVLRRVVAAWPDDVPPGLTTTALLAGAHALLSSDRSGDREAAGDGLRLVAGQQRGDGSWVDADPFHALAVFDAAADAGVGGERVRAALGHGARLLVATQRDNGSWGPENGPRKALIGLRTLLRSVSATG